MDINMLQDNKLNKQKWSIHLALLIGFLVIALSRTYADWLWFDSLGYLAAFKTVLFSKMLLGIGVAFVFFMVISLNLYFVKKNLKLKSQRIYFDIAVLISIIVGYFSSSFWFIIPRYLNEVPFGVVDPLFNKDVSFYVMTLPFFNFLLILSIIILLTTSIMIFIAYLQTPKQKKVYKQPMQDSINIDLEQSISRIPFQYSPKGKHHLAILFAIMLLLVGIYFYFKRFSVLFEHRGAIYGAGYTDIHVMVPLYILLSIICFISAIIAFTYKFHEKENLVKLSAIAIPVVFIIGIFVAGLVQSLYVEPNEYNLEHPYMIENIKHTLIAYKLSDVQIRDFPVTYDLSLKDIEANRQMMENIRLWDWRPLLTTYKQLQLFRTYYDFVDVDIDRYFIDGKMTQLMTSARELDHAQLDAKAKTWVNQHLSFTHGYGIVSSPVNSVTKEGLPDLYIQNIPPKSGYEELQVLEPRIYFGEKTKEYILVDTKANEFDYPLGNENVFTTYNGTDGVLLNSVLRKVAFSIDSRSLNLVISSALTYKSKILVKRNIMERVKTLAPFLEYDDDPYVVVDEGKLYWIIDGYTYSNKFPYSESVGGLNYIRNSVKVIVDAYNGDVSFYVVDTTDPLVKNYLSVFPTLFKSFEEMPPGLKQHIRYPEDLFKLQNYIYGTYHMKDPQVFYNKEDVWQTPKEIYDRSTVDMEPYYIILKLPGEEKEDFVMITPMIPRGKDNMIAWMSASSNPDNYGKLEVFKFSKQELIYGPMQIEARINQDTEISQLFTLWGQQGSQVIRGNMIVIPIENSFLYIEPVYLKASAGGALPQLKRVVVAYGDKLTMQETLDDALRVLFGESTRINKDEKQDMTKTSITLEEKITEVSKLYDEARLALKQGNFTQYGEKIEKIGEILSQK